METIAKPAELLALHGATAELFATLQRWFEVPDQVTLSLREIDAEMTELADPVVVAAVAMRKLQALRLLAQPGVRTSSDVVVALVQDLDPTLMRAPVLRLRRAAAATDWDAELEELVEDAELHGADAGEPARRPAAGDEAPSDPAEEDPEVLRFRERHGQLHRALRAVLAAADGGVVELV